MGKKGLADLIIRDERWKNGNLKIEEANHSEERNVNMTIQRCKKEDKIGFELKTDEAYHSELPIGIVVIKKNGKLKPKKQTIQNLQLALK